MKQKIELSFEAFKRWFNNPEIEPVQWQSLCAEAEKREPVVRYIVKQPDGYMFLSCFEELKAAQDAAKLSNGTVIKLVEEGW
jgi:hypothetical protein